MKRIGLTGGVASGKSTVAALFRRAGIEVFNLDDIGREVMVDPVLVNKVHAACGIQEAQWDPRQVREVIFANENIRRQVEAILHPAIVAELDRRVKKAEAAGARLVICEAALLIESGHHRELDELVVVMAPESTRRQRLVERDGIPAPLADKIITAQVTDADRRAAATSIIDNTGDLVHLEKQVSALVQRWKSA